MDTKDTVIADLMNALDVIKREADKSDASRHFILGAAEQAMRMCDARRERNRDGYPVVVR